MSNPGPVTSDVLSVRGLSKAYGAVQALRDVSIDCRAGEIHALVGENGSGKSTLLGIASGFLAPDEGAVEIGGSRLTHHSPAAARRLGLGIAYQDYSHVLELSVAENLFLAVPAEARPAYGAMRSWAEDTLATFKLDIAVTAAPGSLPLADRQLLEVAKSLLTRPRVLLLDEPTTALGPEAVERLHTLVLERVREGVGIVYVSHRLPEVLAVADRVTVLRDGVGQGTFEAASVSEDALVALMIGRPLTVAFPERPAPAERTDVVLAVSGLRGERFGPVDLEVRKGEILGIAGAEGNGQVPFLRALAGVEPAIGSASCDGAKLDTRSPAGPLRAGVVLLSGDRRGEALFPVLSVRANATIQVLRRLARGGIVLHSRERHAIGGLVERLRVRMASSEQPVQSLSGGNQQKVSLIRPFLRGDIKVILAEEPTQGVDVGARFDIYEALRAKADEGVATVVKSSDPIELAGLCDRVVVMSRGRIVEEIPRNELGERRIVEAIVGSRAGAGAAVREDEGERA
jgi:ribose transport system ATP-binding protein